jgi:hypothetical protein
MSRIPSRPFPLHGRLGLLLIAVFWPLNWFLDGLRTHWGFFPLWLGYCLAVDGLCVRRAGTSLWTRGRGAYLSLFAISAPLWWLFEAINLRTGNWVYEGRESFSDLEYAVLASLSFSTVVPAVLGTAELWAGSRGLRRLHPGPVVSPRPAVLLAVGLAMLALLLLWPIVFFPLVWVSLYFIFDALNLWRGNVSLIDFLGRGNWRPVLALSAGALTCGFFWEFWNFYSYPRWVYVIPWFDFWYLFEMPLPGYGGYPPFALELFAAVHLVFGLAGRGRTDYVTRGLSD